MPKRQVTFNKDPYYDLYDDYDMIDAEFRKVHHITLAEAITDENSTWPLFTSQLSGLGENSYFYYVVSIRSEKDPVKISKFKPSERKMWLDWRKKHNPDFMKKYEERIETQRNIKVSGFIEALKATGNVVEKRK